MVKWLLPWFVTLLLLGCQSTSQLPEPVEYQLQPVPEKYATAFWQHKLQFNQQDELLVHVEFEGQTMNLVALSGAGLPVAQLSWSSDKGLSYIEKPAIPLDWQQVIRDIQWIHWPIEDVQTGLSSAISVRQHKSEHDKILRQFKAQERLIAEVIYQDQTILMNNRAQNYQLKVTLLNEGI